jgi:pimeloyl-ACP methyl ester carboxylesterase
MIEMPPLQFAQTNGIRMGYYEAGPNTDKPPVILCHGWPEMAFSWRHQIKALSEAGIRVIAPDQRGYGATDRPEPVEAYDMEHLTGDLVGLMDHLKIDKAIFVGHDWGGFIVWQMPLRHPARVAGVVGLNTPHWDRAPVDPIELFKMRYGDQMYIVQFQNPAREPDRIFGSRVAQTFDFLMREPVPRKADAPATPPTAGVGAPPKLNLAIPQMGGLRPEIRSTQADPVARGDEGVRRRLHRNRLHRRHQLVPQLDPQLATRGRPRSQRTGSVADDHGGE